MSTALVRLAALACQWASMGVIGLIQAFGENEVMAMSEQQKIEKNVSERDSL